EASRRRNSFRKRGPTKREDIGQPRNRISGSKRSIANPLATINDPAISSSSTKRASLLQSLDFRKSPLPEAATDPMSKLQSCHAPSSLPTPQPRELLKMFSQSLARDVGTHGITVNNVQPATRL